MKYFFYILIFLMISCESKSQEHQVDLSKENISHQEIDKETGWIRILLNKPKKYGFIDQDRIVKVPFEYDFLNPFDENKLSYGKKDGKELFINSEGKIIILPIYEKLGLFSEGLIAAKKNNKTGYLDTKGNLIIPFIYESFYSFYQGVTIVSKGKKFGFINNEGKVVIPIIYDDAQQSHSDKILLVKKDKKWAFIDIQGKLLSDFIYEKVFSGYNLNTKPPSNLSAVTTYFRNGAVLVQKEKKYEFLNEKIEPAFPNSEFDSASVFDTYQNAIVKRNGKFGIIKPDGEAKVPIEYDFVEYFDSNHITSEYYNARKGKIYTIFNRDLKKLGESYEPVYNDFSTNTPSVIFRNLNNKYGMTSSNGEILIPFEYDKIDKIKGTSFFLVSKKNKFGVIDDNRKVKIPLIYDQISQLDLDDQNLFIVSNKNEDKVVDLKGNIIISGYESIEPIFTQATKFIVQKNKKFGIIDINKNTILPYEYDYISNWTEYGPSNSKFIVKNGKTGLINEKTFKVTIPPIYDKFRYIQGLIFAKKKDKSGILTEDGKVLCDFIYDEIYPNLRDFYVNTNVEPRIYAKKGNSYFQIDTKGKILKSNLTEKFVIENPENQPPPPKE